MTMDAPILLRALMLSIMAMCLAACGGLGENEKDQKELEERATYHYNLAYGHYFDSTNKNVDASLQELLKSLQAKPDFPEAHFLAGVIYLGRTENGLAIRHFQTAIRLKPEYYDAHNNLGAAFLNEARWDDAIQVFEELVGQIKYATPGHAYNNLGWALYNKGELKAAESQFRQALNLNPRLCMAYNNLGQALFDQKKTEQAEKYLKRGIRRCEGYAEPHFHLGRLYLSGRKTKVALGEFEACVKLSGDSPLGERCQNMVKSLSKQLGVRR